MGDFSTRFDAAVGPQASEALLTEVLDGLLCLDKDSSGVVGEGARGAVEGGPASPPPGPQPQPQLQPSPNRPHTFLTVLAARLTLAIHVTAGVYAAVSGKSLLVRSLQAAPGAPPQGVWRGWGSGGRPAHPLACSPSTAGLVALACAWGPTCDVPPQALAPGVHGAEGGPAGVALTPDLALGDPLGVASALLHRLGQVGARAALCARVVADLVLLLEVVTLAGQGLAAREPTTLPGGVGAGAGAGEVVGSPPSALASPATPATPGATAAAAAAAAAASGHLANGFLVSPVAMEAAVGLGTSQLLAYPSTPGRGRRGRAWAQAADLATGRLEAVKQLVTMALHHAARHLLSALALALAPSEVAPSPGLHAGAAPCVAPPLGPRTMDLVRSALHSLSSHAQGTREARLTLAVSRALVGLGEPRAALSTCAAAALGPTPTGADPWDLLHPGAWDRLPGAGAADLCCPRDGDTDGLVALMVGVVGAARGCRVAPPPAPHVLGVDPGTPVSALLGLWVAGGAVGAVPAPAAPLAPWPLALVHWRWRLACTVAWGAECSRQHLDRMVDLRAAAARAFLALRALDVGPDPLEGWGGDGGGGGGSASVDPDAAGDAMDVTGEEGSVAGAGSSWLLWLRRLQAVWLCSYLWSAVNRRPYVRGVPTSPPPPHTHTHTHTVTPTGTEVVALPVAGVAGVEPAPTHPLPAMYLSHSWLLPPSCVRACARVCSIREPLSALCLCLCPRLQHP